MPTPRLPFLGLLALTLLSTSVVACVDPSDDEPADDELAATTAIELQALPAGIAAVRMTGTGALGTIGAYDAADVLVTRANQTAATRTSRTVAVTNAQLASLQVVSNRLLESSGAIALAGAVNGRLYKIVKPVGGVPTVTARPIFTTSERSLITTWSALDAHLIGLASLRPCLVHGVRTAMQSQACLAGEGAACARAFDAAAAAAVACPAS